MRVGLVVRGGVDRSGRERVIPAILWLIERMARRHELHVFALDYYDEPCTYPLLGATVHDVGRANAVGAIRRAIHARRLTAALARVGRFDVLHAYWALPAGLAAIRAGRWLRTPVVVTADSGEFSSIPDIQYGLQRLWLDRRAATATFREAARVTVCSRYMADLASRCGVQVHDVIPIGVPRQPAPPPARSGGPPWQLLHVASINRVKDHETLLHALAHIVQQEPRVHLDLVGEDTLAGAVQWLARELALTSHVSFHGLQPNDALVAFYARAHVHLVSSRHEAASVVTLEAAAAAVPTVGTNVGYLAEWAPQGRAIAVPVRDPLALGQDVLRLLRDPDLRRRIATSAREWVLAHDADWTADQFDRCYRQAAK